LGRVEAADDTFDPGGEFQGNIERRAVAGLPVGVAQTREQFVLHIPRRPHAVKIEAAGVDGAGGQLLEKNFAVNRAAGGAARGIAHQCANVAVALRILHFLVFITM